MVWSAKLCVLLGLTLCVCALSPAAGPSPEKRMRAALEAARTDPPRYLVLLDELARFYSARKQYAKAEPLLRRALRMRERLLGTDHLDVAEALDAVAAACRGQGKTDEAELLSKRALAIRALPRKIFVFRVGQGVTPPVAISRAEPEYTKLAEKAGHEGAVALSFVVDETGRPRSFHVMRALGLGLDEKAIEALSKWRYQPALRDGKPVPVIAEIEVSFKLPAKKPSPGP